MKLRNLLLLAGVVGICLVARANHPHLPRPDGGPHTDIPHYEHETLEDQPYKKGELLYEDDFSDDLSNWKAEGPVKPKLGEGPWEGMMEVDTSGGLTTWFKKKLSGPVMIEYERIGWAKGGENDRVSDMNCFWMATDPEHPDDFFARSEWRAGNFSHYNGLQLYYVGYGGGNNTHCRFRRYPGDGSRPQLDNYDHNPHYLVVPSHTYKFQLVAYGGLIQFIRDGEVIFEYQDPNPFQSGYFGFRTVHNHEFIDNFKVYRLKPKETKSHTLKP
ncbi:MAG: DUF6250 domain-containing protein [Planctomycetota bacterium]